MTIAVNIIVNAAWLGEVACVPNNSAAGWYSSAVYGGSWSAADLATAEVRIRAYDQGGGGQIATAYAVYVLVT